MSNNIPRLLRLKENHPVMQKVFKLYDLAEELGIKIHWRGQEVWVNDRDHPDIDFYMEDIDDASALISEFPPTFEFKMIFNNPEWLKLKEAEENARLQRMKEDAERREKEHQALLAAQEAARKAKIEAEERELLNALKKKYEDR